jgi:hypothetical protein
LDDNEFEKKKKKEKYSIFGVFFKEMDNLMHLTDAQLNKQVLFTYIEEEVSKKNDFDFVFRKSRNGVLHQDVFNQQFLIPYQYGILNFPQILNEEEDQFINQNFQSKIANYYNESFEKAYKIFCDDWISLCSNYNWHPKFESIDEDLDPKTNLANKFINGLVDFGTITSIL